MPTGSGAPGALTLTGDNSFSGGITMAAGRLGVGGSQALGSGILTMNEGTILQFAASGLTLANGIVFSGTADPTIDTGSNTGTISGAISGAGGLAKLGSGTLILTAANTYTGATTIASGSLDVTGSIANSVVTIASGATLAGSGSIGGLAAQTGAIVAPGRVTPFSTLNVAGNASFSQGSTFLVNINAAGRSDQLAVTGFASLSGGTVNVLAANGSYLPTTRYTILAAKGGVSGAFAQLGAISNLAFLSPMLSYDANSVFLGFTPAVVPPGQPGVGNPVTFPSVTVSRNQAMTAAAVQGLGLGNPVYNAVVGQSVAGARQAFDALSGEVHASAVTAAFEDARLPREAILDRLNRPLETPLLGVASTMTGAYAADLPGRRPNLAPVEARMYRPRLFDLWGQGFGNWGRTSNNGNAASLSRSTGGFVLGADTTVSVPWSGSWRFGVAGGYTNDSLKITQRQSSGSVESVFGALYGSTSFGPLQLRAGAVYGANSTSTTRQVIFPGFADAVGSSYDGSTAQAFGEAGYRIGLSQLGIGRASLEPFVAAAAIHIHQDGFSEAGGAAALTGFGRSYDLATTTIGLRAETMLAGPLPLTARALLGWRHAYGDVVPAALLAFQGGSQAFKVAGVPIDRDAVLAEAGVDYAVTSAVTLGLSYSGQFGQRAADNAFKGNLDISF